MTQLITIYQQKPLKAIVTKHHATTAKTGPRVSARCSAGKIFLPWDKNISREDNFRAAAIALCAKLKLQDPLVQGSLKDGSNVFVQAPEILVHSGNGQIPIDVSDYGDRHAKQV